MSFQQWEAECHRFSQGHLGGGQGMDRWFGQWAPKFLQCSRRACTIKGCTKTSAEEGFNSGVGRSGIGFGGTDATPNCPTGGAQGELCPERWCHSCRRSCKWSWRKSSSLCGSYGKGPSSQADSGIVGSPSQDKSSRPCVRCGGGAARRRTSGSLFKQQSGSDGASGGSGVDSAKHSHNGPCSTSSIRRSACRLGFRRRRIKRALREGGGSKGEDADRPRNGVISILSGSASADLPEDVSCSPRPEDRGRGCELGSNHVWVPGEAWNLQGAEGSCPYPMDTCPCVRQCSKRRFSDLQRIPGSNGSKLGSSGIGWKLEHRISHIVAGRTAIPDDVREAESPFVSWSPICGHGAGSVECSGFGISSRDGIVAEQKKRVEDCKAGEKGGSHTFTKKEAKVSKKAKAPGRGGREIDRSVKQPGKSFLPHVHHDNPAVNSSDQHPSFVPHTADRPSNRCRSEALGDNLHNGLGLGDSIVGPDNRPAGDSSEVVGSYLSTSWSYLKWCASLVPMVLRSRTPFASFLSQSIKLSKIPSGRSGLASTFFPVPIPLFEVFGRMPESSSASVRHARQISRATHVIVMALNFWHFGGHVCDLELLRREPTCQHLSLFKRLRFLIKSDWPAEVLHLPKAGRKFPQLVARISELSECLTNLGPSSNPYEKAFSGVDVPLDNSAMPELSPYRDLDPSRLRIKGNGLWDATSFLDDELSMVYREPAVIRFSEEPTVVPNMRDSRETLGQLARLWDSRGLLFIHDRPVGHSSHVRVFNTLKSISQDRQIGDRRAMNSQEAKVCGPSSDLPAGSDLTSLIVCPHSERITISITDRSDFYHQFKSSPSRARTNTLFPSIPISLVKGTAAYENFLAGVSKKKVREQVGDHLEGFVPSPVLVSPDPGCLWISFNSVLQGDHAGVEIATESHANLLRSHGLLQPNERLVASSPLKSFSEAAGSCDRWFFRNKHSR